MKAKNLFKAFAAIAVLIPATLGAIIAFHPGVAFSQPRFLTAMPQGDLPDKGEFTPDPMHTCIGFEIDHMGLSRIQGRFNKFSGLIVANKDVKSSSVKFTIKTSSVDTAVAPRDADLRSANYFDAEKFPDMVYESTSITKTEKGYLSEGNLTLKGVTKPVSIPFKVFGPVKGFQGKARIGIVADPIKIKRSDYNMANGITGPGGGPGVGDEVTIRISLEASM